LAKVMDQILGGPLEGRAAWWWAAAGGLAQALAWPRLGWWPLTWLAPILLWRAISGQSGGRAFRLGWLYGLVLSLVSAGWLADVLAGYGGLGTVGGVTVTLLLAAYLATFQGLWALVMAPWTLRAPVMDGRLLVPALWGGLLWGGLDQLKNLLLTGFNWTPLAGGLAPIPALIGPADLVGIYGLTPFVAATALLLAASLDLRRHRAASLWRLGAAGLTLAAQLSYGLSAVARWEREQAQWPPRTVAALQASIPQDVKYDPRFRADTMARYDAILDKARAARPWLTVWPETAAPFIYGWALEETAWLDRLIARAAEEDSPMLVGVAALDTGPEGSISPRNRAILAGPDGPSGVYDKTHLVPFGEYIPLVDILPILRLPFAQGLLGEAGTYRPGRTRHNLVLGDVPFGVLICFESIFPYQARERALKGARLLIVTTNDAWFGASAAPSQHLMQAAMRSAETRLPLVRAANNGISALIAPSGRILALSPQNEVDAYVWELRLPPGPSRTLFVRGGYWLAPACGLLAAAAVARALFRSARSWRTGRRRRRAGPGGGRRRSKEPAQGEPDRQGAKRSQGDP
jgi:apolipoprotein N-acyltransferase